MKRIFYLVVLLFSVVTYSQSGLYEGISLYGASNFIGKTNGAMHQYGGEFEFGYQFNPIIRVGIFYPIEHTIFRANQERYSLLGSSGGIKVNTRLYQKEDFSLRLNVSSALIDTKRQQEGLGDTQRWFFLKTSAGLQFHDCIDDMNSIFFGIGVNYYTDSHKYSDTFSKRYHFFTPYLCIGGTLSHRSKGKK